MKRNVILSFLTCSWLVFSATFAHTQQASQKPQVESEPAYPLTIPDLFKLLMKKDHRFKTTENELRFKTAEEKEQDLNQKFKVLKKDATGIDYEITEFPAQMRIRINSEKKINRLEFAIPLEDFAIDPNTGKAADERFANERESEFIRTLVGVELSLDPGIEQDFWKYISFGRDVAKHLKEKRPEQRIENSQTEMSIRRTVERLVIDKKNARVEIILVTFQARHATFRLPSPDENGPPRSPQVKQVVQSFEDRGASYLERDNEAGYRQVRLTLPFDFAPGDIPKLLQLTHVTHLRCEDEGITDSVVKAIAKLPELRELGFYHAGITGASLQDLRPLKKLTSLSVTWTNIGDTGAQHIGSLTGLTSLRLSLSEITDKGMESLANLKQLNTLDLSSDSITDKGLEHIQFLKQLSDLDLSSHKITDAGLRHLSALTMLTKIRLNCEKINGPGLKHLTGLTHLKELSIDTADLADDGLQHLSQCKSLTSLRIIGARHATDKGLKDLSQLTNLDMLNMSNSGITAAGLKELQPLINLKSLYLVNCPIADAGVSDLQSLKNLNSLDLDGTQISDAAIPELAKLTDLRSLSLKRTRVTRVGFARIRHLMPECRVD
ncbi:MAG: hypothetical protein V4719_25925 [Planctomycetota bacterium]